MSNKNVDKQWQQQTDIAAQVAHQASLEIEQQVPAWDRSTAFKQFSRRHDASSNKVINGRWWQWRGIPALSMAFSAAAVMLMATFMQINQSNKPLDKHVITVLINEQVEKKVAEQLAYQVNIKLREFAAEQQVLLANYRADLSEKQQSNNLKLASYVLGASRKERQEDMGDFIHYINSQRKDEQLDQKIKFQQLEQAINVSHLTNKPVKQYKMNYKPKHSSSLGLNNESTKQNTTS
ncbi:MAG: hypothetical protein OCD00_04020 [Colwellia sp.]